MSFPRARARWSGRRLTSYLMLFAALALVLSGLALYLKPQGRVAHSLGWRLIGLSKDEWERVHTGLSVLFLAAAAWHLWLNYRALWGYIKGFLARAWSAKAELVLAVALLLFTWVGSLRDWAPFDWLSLGKAEARAHWERVERRRSSVPSEDEVRVVPQDYEPPAARGQQGGMGRLSLAEFCRDRGIDLEAARVALAEKGVKVDGGERLREVAERAGLHPRELEALLRSRAGGP